MVEDAAGAPLASCSLWWTRVPELRDERLGLIGEYSDTSDDAAAILLTAARERLRSAGCTLAVGPMDGSTWRRYRFMTERGKEPEFFMEPANPPEWPARFIASGFEPLAEYYSALNRDLTWADPRVPRIEGRINETGVTIRPLDRLWFDDDLRRIFQISLAAFPDNFLYTPISEPEFMAMYRQIEPHLAPDLVLLAECAGEPVGYVFALPDLEEARRGETPRTVIVKTLAVVPGRRVAGLGTLLLHRVQQTAHRLGFRRAIHALMHESNNSRNLSGHYAETFRRYTLFSRRLDSSPR